MSTTALATHQSPSLVAKFATRFGVDATKLLDTLKSTAFKQSEGKSVSNEQMMALLIVADQYGLNPFTKEIFAFDDKHKGIVPVVSVDGWARIINDHPQCDGVEFRYSEKLVTMTGGKPCPEWCEAVFTRKDRSQPIVVREYLDEVYIGPRGNPPKNGPWQTHTKRFLRHKTYIQGGRIAFGFGGIHDEDEAYRIIDGQASRVEVIPRAEVADLQARLTQRAQTVIEHAPDVEFTEREPLTDTERAADAVDAALPDTKKLRGRIFVAETKKELDDAAADIALLPEGDDKAEVNELYLRRCEEVEAAR